MVVTNIFNFVDRIPSLLRLFAFHPFCYIGGSDGSINGLGGGGGIGNPNNNTPSNTNEEQQSNRIGPIRSNAAHAESSGVNRGPEPTGRAAFNYRCIDNAGDSDDDGVDDDDDRENFKRPLPNPAPLAGLNKSKGGKRKGKRTIVDRDGSNSSNRKDETKDSNESSENIHQNKKPLLTIFTADFIDIKRTGSSKNSGVIDTHRFRIKVDEDRVFNRTNLTLGDAFRRVMKEIIQHLRQVVRYVEFQVRFWFTFNDSDRNEFHVNIPYDFINDDDIVDELCRRLETAFQSGDKASFSDFLVEVQVFHNPAGSGYFTPTGINFKKQHHLITKHLHTSNTDKTKTNVGCGFNAIAVCVKKITHKIDVNNMDNVTIRRLGENIAEQCGLTYADPLGVDQFAIIEKKLKCRIFVYANDRNGLMYVVYKPRENDRDKPLYIIGYDAANTHYYYPLPGDKIKLTIKNANPNNIKSHVFCHQCYSFVTNMPEHLHRECEYYKCLQCFKYECRRGDRDENTPFLYCKDCNRYFYSKTCFDNHRPAICNKVKICDKCDTMKIAAAQGQFYHDCVNIECFVCRESYNPDKGVHKCFMKTIKPKEEGWQEKQDVFTFYYDVETYNCNEQDDGNGKSTVDMIPYLLVSMLVCYKCSEKELDDDEHCIKCGVKRTEVFQLDLTAKEEYEKCPVDKFINYLFKFSEAHPKSKIIVAAYNGRKFDTQFVFSKLLARPGASTFSSNPVKRGTKIITMSTEHNITFKDTLLYMPCALKKLPKCMGIVGDVDKGFFPYRFLTSENADYIGNIPPRNMFETDRMNENETREFNEWYNTFNNREYNIKAECMKYCVQDVNILRKSFEKFRKMFIDMFKIDCLTECCTIASLCFTVFKTHFMKDETIAHISRDGQLKYSYEGIRWLAFMEKYTGQNIAHARNGGERVFKLKNKRVHPDGYVEVPVSDYMPINGDAFVALRDIRIDEGLQDRNERRWKEMENNGPVEKKRVVYLFHGCIWHGHQSCSNGKLEHRKVSSLDRYRMTLLQEAAYRQAGFEVVRVWECMWKKMKDECKVWTPHEESLREYVNRIGNEITSHRLIVGDSLYGGRTEPFVYYYPPTNGTSKIYYLDFTSLYPWVQKTQAYPVGLPTKLVGDKIPSIQDYIAGIEGRYFGLAYVCVLPPQHLYIPVLPGRYNGKLVFTLCRTCAKDGNEELCSHTPRQRELLGVYTSPELKQAVEKGYEILKIFELWTFKSTVGLFTDYVKAFLKWKTEASGFPPGITDITDPELDIFIEAFERIEGVRLTKENIKNNPGLRFIAKLCLNSLWGKMAQRPPHTEDIICHTDAEVWALAKQADLEITNIVVAGQKHIVCVRYTGYANHTSKSTNLPVASFTTAHARVKLYKLLDSLKQRVLYCDTDSCIFIAKEGDEVPETGRFLGDLTDEIGEGMTADSFVCTGPKSYAVRLLKEDGSIDHILKSKGLTLNRTTKDIVNFEGMLKIVLDKIDKDAENDEREWLMGDERYYHTIKNHDLTAIAIKQMRENEDPTTIHNTVYHEDDTNKPYVIDNTHYREVKTPSMTFRATKKGDVSITKGTKRLRMTSTKRALIKNTARTIPFGFRGRLEPI